MMGGMSQIRTGNEGRPVPIAPVPEINSLHAKAAVVRTCVHELNDQASQSDPLLRELVTHLSAAELSLERAAALAKQAFAHPIA